MRLQVQARTQSCNTAAAALYRLLTCLAAVLPEAEVVGYAEARCVQSHAEAHKWQLP